MEDQRIESKTEHKEVARRILQLFNAEPGTPEEQELERLVKMSEEYIKVKSRS
jgi:hypothetical protein